MSTWLRSKGKTRLWRTGRSCCWSLAETVQCTPSEMRICGWQKYSSTRSRYSNYGWRLKLRYHNIVFCWPLYMETKMMAYDRVVAELNVAKLRGGPRDILSYCSLPRWSLKHHMHHFLCTSSLRSPYIHLFFHSVTSHSNDSKLAYTRKNHRRTTCSPNTHILTSSTIHSSNRIEREFARLYLGSPEFRGANALTVAYRGLLRIPTRAEASPRKYSVASQTNYWFSPFI